MGFLEAAKEAVRKAKEEENAAERAFQAEMKQYDRGFDVFPDEVRDQFISGLRKGLIKTVLEQLLFILLLSGGIVFSIIKDNKGMIVFIAPVMLITAYFALANASRLNKISGGRYDAYGAMITNSSRDVERYTDRDGRRQTDTDYYFWLNGVKCRVGEKDFKTFGRGMYCYFIRLRGKYTCRDDYYFYPAAPEAQDRRIGQYIPEKEVRLDSPPKPGRSASGTAALGLFGCIVGVCIMVVEGLEGRVWLTVTSVSAAVIVIGCIAMAVSRNNQNIRMTDKNRSKQTAQGKYTK